MRAIIHNQNKLKVYVQTTANSQPIIWRLGVCLVALSLTMLYGNERANAGESPFLPDQRAYFSSAKPLSGNGWLTQLTRSMDNKALRQTVLNVKTNDMSAAHRAHNLQWINQHGVDSDDASGKEILRKLLTASVKKYWDEIKASQFNDLASIPDANGQGQLNFNRTELDYKLRISGSRIKLVIRMEF